MGLEKGKQGRSREEKKSERSQTQTLDCGGEFGSSSMCDQKFLDNFLLRKYVKEKPELHNS